MKKIIDGAKVTFTFNDGVEPLVFNTGTMSPTCIEYAIPFAMGHRLGDAAAGCKTEQERRAAVAALAAHYETGTADWNTRTASGATAKSDQAAIELLSEMMDMTVEEARAAYMAKKATRA